MQVTPEKVREIINANDGNESAHIASLSEIKYTSFSHTASWKSYHIALSNSDRSYLLLVSPLDHSRPALAPKSITLPVLSILLNKILDSTAVPVPRPVAHDVEGNWPFGWLLLRVPGLSQIPPTSLKSIRTRLSDGQLARIELKLGAYLRALHGITNDSFGIPSDKPLVPPSLPSFSELLAANQTGEDGVGYGEEMMPYSWQDTFVQQLEELLDYVCEDATSDRLNVNIGELRRSLVRAIGSFLFDDVEIPSLIWVTGNEEDVIVSIAQRMGGEHISGTEEVTEADIAYILPTFAHALWGDPLMEAWFLPPGPAGAMNEGYFGEEKDGTLFLFSRHRTKRLWYTVYLALVVLAEEISREGESTHKADREIMRWARNTLLECTEILKDAPCY